MANIPHNLLPDKTIRVALYGRVSTDDQAERGTLQNQLDFLRSFVKLYGLESAGEYLDDGISGALALGDRPEGRRLLEDAQAGRFSVVLVYRLDRLGRSLAALITAHDQLAAAGVTIRSATEPFDTSTSIGTFLFQLLGSLAQLERSTIKERMTMGRTRVAKAGKWVGGVIPLGYDLDDKGSLIPSRRCIEATGLTEDALARDIIERIAEGSSAVAEARRLNALRVPCQKRYKGEKLDGHTSGIWQASRINQMIRNPLYYGRHVYHSNGEPIERAVPALVDRLTWERAGAQLTANRKQAKRNLKREYLLRGLITCGSCGANYCGAASVKKNGYEARFYRCGSYFMVLVEPTCRCTSKAVLARDLEEKIWRDCVEFVRNPGAALAEAQRQLRSRLDRATDTDANRRALVQQIAEKDAERERVLTMYRRNRITIVEAESHLDAIASETTEIRRLLEALRAQEALAEAMEVQLTNAAVVLDQLRHGIEAAEAEDNFALRRQVVELLVSRVTVNTTGEGRSRRAAVEVTYTFGPAKNVSDVAVETRTVKCNRSKPGVSAPRQHLHQARLGLQPPHGIIRSAMDKQSLASRVLIFAPDDVTMRRYRAAFGRLRIFPGYAGPVVRTTGQLIRIGDSLKAWSSSQFRAVESFGPGELEAYRAAAERSLYADFGLPKVSVGDRVRFQPSDLCELMHYDEYTNLGLFPTYTGVITSIAPDGFVDVDRLGLSLHWSEFVASAVGARSEPGRKKVT